MEKKKIEITVENSVKALDIREGKLPDLHIPGKIEIYDHVISSAYEFLRKEGIEPFFIKDSYIRYSIEERYINLFYNTRNINPDTVTGVLKLHPDLKKFEINQGKSYTTHSLADFIRMNRHYFESKDVALKLVSELQNFKAKVDKEIESSDDKRANVKMFMVQKVVSNIPTEFVLLLPLFIGSEKTPIKVEIDINAQDISCTLISPALKELIDTESKAIIDQQLKQIEELYPQLKMFQA